MRGLTVTQQHERAAADEAALGLMDICLTWVEANADLFSPEQWREVPEYRDFPESRLCELVLALRPAHSIPAFSERVSALAHRMLGTVDWADVDVRRRIRGPLRHYHHMFAGAARYFPREDETGDSWGMGDAGNTDGNARIAFRNSKGPDATAPAVADVTDVGDVERAYAAALRAGVPTVGMCTPERMRDLVADCLRLADEERSAELRSRALYSLTHLGMYYADFGRCRPPAPFVHPGDAERVRDWCVRTLQAGDVDLGGELAFTLSLTEAGNGELARAVRMMLADGREWGHLRGPHFSPQVYAAAATPQQGTRYTFWTCYHATVVAILCAARLLAEGE